jgi:hypothetical protein
MTAEMGPGEAREVALTGDHDYVLHFRQGRAPAGARVLVDDHA